MTRQNEWEIIQESRTLSEEDLDNLASTATSELATISTLNETRQWWKKYYLKLGHRRLGRIIIGKNPRKPIIRKQKVKDSNTKNNQAVTQNEDHKPIKSPRRKWNGPNRVR